MAVSYSTNTAPCGLTLPVHGMPLHFMDGQCQDGQCQDGQCQDGQCQDGQCQDGQCQDGQCQDGQCQDGSVRTGSVRTGSVRTAVSGRAVPVWRSRTSKVSGSCQKVHVSGSWRRLARRYATSNSPERRSTYAHARRIGVTSGDLKWPINFDPVPECRD